MNKYAELQKIAVLYVACRGLLRIKLAATMKAKQFQDLMNGVNAADWKKYDDINALMASMGPKQARQFLTALHESGDPDKQAIAADMFKIYQSTYGNHSQKAIREWQLAPTTPPNPAAPAQTPAQAPAQTPAQVATPTQTTAQTPAQTPAQAPAQTTAQTPAQAPADPKDPNAKRTWGQFFQEGLDWVNEQVKAQGTPDDTQREMARQTNNQQYLDAMAALSRGEYNGYDPNNRVYAEQISKVDNVAKDPNAKPAEGAAAGGGSTPNITINNNIPGSGGEGGGGEGAAAGGGGMPQQFQQQPGLADYIQQYSQRRRANA